MILFRVPLNCSQTVLSVVDLSASFAFDAYMQIFCEISYAEPLYTRNHAENSSRSG